jgi:ATP-binding cassette subfamily B protein
LLGAHAAVFGALSLEVLRGSLDIAELAVAVQAAFAMASLGWTGDVEWQLTGASAAIPHALAVRKHAGGVVERAGASTADGMPVTGISLESVTFRYPGSDQPAVDGLDLWIPAGASLALVGENGAGKTTIVKLLARCHDPDRGRICVDGIPLGDLDPHAWRRQLAMVFQDFLRFELSARDNVAFGRVDDQLSESQLRAAARLAGAEELIASLPQGWDTMLSRRYPGGTDLSGGQWQRLALARALLAARCGARVLVLDEPTAHLDARAEAELYARFLELTAGITTILISHRFGTVRLADHICVLHGGRVSEQGSHEELLERDGRYARMFRLQADRFVSDRRA